MSYKEKFIGVLNPEVARLLDSLVERLEDLRSGRVEEELNERIFEMFERARKAQILREKPMIQMAMQRDLEHLYNARGVFRKQAKAMENQTMEAIAKLTHGLMDSISTMLNGLIPLVNGEARQLISNTMAKLSNFHYANSIQFQHELEKLGEKLDAMDTKPLQPKQTEEPVATTIILLPEVMDSVHATLSNLNNLLNQ